jgi:diguanylate cyclase (GGDEF)-like protein/PAS domain S-box-containing protein
MMLKTPAMRISVALILLMVNLLFLANLLGFVPDASESALELRKSLSESLALQFSAAAEEGDSHAIQKTLRAVVERNEKILSAAIRTQDGKLIALAGEHLAQWQPPADGKSTPSQVQVAVHREGKNWATVEIRFTPLWANDLAGGFTNSFAGLIGFLTLSGLLCYFVVLKRSLRELDPSAVIPERVQRAFDVLQEGVLILDEKEQIVMANRSFAGLVGKSTAELVGLKGSELGWRHYHSPEHVENLPWCEVLRDGLEQKGASLSLTNQQGRTIKLMVNASKVSDNNGKCRGTLVTFDDITQLEEKNFELRDLVEKLQLANEEIQSKNKKLNNLANYDPLTQCLNRRSLTQKFHRLFTHAKTTGLPLSCLMVDIDFFKSVNDRYGHATGDEVIKAVANALKKGARETDLVGRYGGEEFCMVLPKLSIEKAARIAERIRLSIEQKPCSGIKVTISLGVASLETNTNNPEELINQADKALYAAKKGGRNRVVAWGEALPEAEASPPEESTSADEDQTQLQCRVQELEGLLEKRAAELQHLEMYDLKTGLPTRALFEDRMGHEIARAGRKHHLVAVLSMKIDTIKRVHNTLGYKVAGRLATACAQRLNTVLRENIDMVAMIDSYKGLSSVTLINDAEFGILLTDITKADHVTWVVKRMLDAFHAPFQIQDSEIYVSAYFGVSIFPHDADTVEELYSCATNACSYAQQLHGKERYYFSSQQLNEMSVHQLKIENALYDAIDKDELQLHYQPKIKAATGQIAGFEALLRWNSAQLGSIPPEQFIPVAEQSGHIDALGDWVIDNACRQLRAWMDMGLAVVPVAVNMSGVQLRQSELVHRIRDTLDAFDIDTDLIEIELTESSLVNIYDTSYTTLSQIHEMGLHLAMDDFGTGYSSLSYLRNIPLSALKIDRYFITDIDKDESAKKLVASIISMAHGLGLEVVGEGVEKKHQADHLTALGCEFLQGYYFSRPVPHDEAVKMLQRQADG